MSGNSKQKRRTGMDSKRPQPQKVGKSVEEEGKEDSTLVKRNIPSPRRRLVARRPPETQIKNLEVLCGGNCCGDSGA